MGSNRSGFSTTPASTIRRTSAAVQRIRLFCGTLTLPSTLRRPVCPYNGDMDRFDLDRFVQAQEGTFEGALAELRRGRKTGHWMWFVFPQIAGLGFSAMAQRYAISGLDEARAYLDHPVLGPRLVACAQALLDLGANDAVAVMGGIDAQKLRSSMTLFVYAGDEGTFRAVLERFFRGEEDSATLDRL